LIKRKSGKKLLTNRPKILNDRTVSIHDPLTLKTLDFIEAASENPVLWTEMKGASAESTTNKSDAETSSA